MDEPIVVSWPEDGCERKTAALCSINNVKIGQRILGGANIARQGVIEGWAGV
jgi:hypothetical protein